MKESITKFDLEAAFKALDDIDTPVAEKGIKANRPALTEIFSRKSKFDLLFEEYYDINSGEGLDDAKAAREAEVAKAKLERIEKIVDLDADSPEDLLTSYVGKYIMQCPQCMTLFYKDKEDIVESEDDSTTVNVNEVCQHCGNETGYTLIGKVGEAESEPEAAEDETDISLDEVPSEEEVEESSEEAAENSDENEEFDLEGELDELDLNIEDDESEEKKEEDFQKGQEGSYLVEQLTEDADLDVSESEFEELISSPEFQTPISDQAVRAMMDTENKNELDESIEVNSETLSYVVINPDGTYAGAPCTSLEEARELAAQKEGRVIGKLEKADLKELTEGGLGLLGKTLAKKAKQVGQKIKGKASDAIDKFADNTMTREEKADWVIKNTLNPGVKKVTLDNEGKVIPNEKDRKFDTFVVIGYKGYFSDGETIAMSPTKDNEDLVIGMPEPQFRQTYTEAEELAKGWSMDQKGGPAMIFLTKGKTIDAPAYLCQFFKGELDAKQDKLEEYFKFAKQDLEGKEHITKGGGVKGEQDGPKTESKKASELAVGNIIILDKKGAKITEINQSKFQSGSYTIKAQYGDGDTDVVTFQGNQKVTVVVDTGTNESIETPTHLQSIMESLEELNDTAIETSITEALIKNYKNVAGFRLTECKYSDDILSVNGRVIFESSNIRDITFKFTKASNKNGKVVFEGLNEKLGKDKNFVLTGNIKGTVLVAESFKQIKKFN